MIGGFLGAGKSTLLRHWLLAAPPAGQRPPRLALLVNDFGAVNLDAALLAEALPPAAADGAPTLLALSNGCVCCSIGSDLGAAIDTVLAQHPPPEALLIEASGVADPWRIAQHALAEPRLALHAVLLLVDAAALDGHLADPLLTDTLTRPLAHADLVVLNHADRASPAQLQAAQDWVQADAEQRGKPPPAITTTVQAQLPPLLTGAPLYQGHGGWPSAPAAPGGPPAAAADSRWPAPASAGSHAQQFSAWSTRPEGRYDRQRLRAWLPTLPAAVLRLKARLPLAEGGWIDLQWAGRHAVLRPLPAPPAEGAALVAIALTAREGMAALQAVAQGLQGCCSPATPHDDPGDPR